jgi:hypothetical protein
MTLFRVNLLTLDLCMSIDSVRKKSLGIRFIRFIRNTVRKYFEVFYLPFLVGKQGALNRC